MISMGRLFFLLTLSSHANQKRKEKFGKNQKKIRKIRKNAENFGKIPSSSLTLDEILKLLQKFF